MGSEPSIKSMPDFQIKGVSQANSAGFMRRLSQMVGRMNFAGLLGQVFSGKRDYWEVFGYERILTASKIWQMYHRGGIAHRVIHAYPDAIWSKPPQMYLKDNPEWNASWDKLVRDLKLWDIIKRADVLAGLGRYACIFVGTSNGNLTQPLRRDAKLKFLQPYAERHCQVSKWDLDPTSPRFGMPLMYTIYPNARARDEGLGEMGGQVTSTVQSSFQVHASRIIHISRGALESKVYGIPRYAPIWNYLLDLIKVVGSSAESYWMTAYQGIHADVDSEMEMEEGDAQDLSDEIDEYQHGLRRYIRTRGVTIKSLGSKVADPRGAFDVVLTLISGTTGIPKRILVGSEAGQLASNQDRANWAERVEEERSGHAEPDIIWPFLEWMNESGVFEVDLENVQILWPDAYRMSPLERGQTSAQTARTASTLLKAMEPIVTKKGSAAVIDPVTGEEIIPATEDVTDEPLITRDEARRIIGLSTDQHALQEQPV